MLNNSRHSVRNVWRNKLRAAVIIIIIGIASALVLTMTTIDASVQNQVQALESSVGTGIDIRPAGSFGGLGNGSMLDASLLETIKDVPHIENISTSFTAMLQMSGQASQGNRPGERRMGLMLTGVKPGEELQLFGGGKAELLTGRTFTEADQEQSVVIIGEALAEANEWALGETINVGEHELEIVGIVASETRFGAMSFFLPLETAQALTGQEGTISQAKVLVDRLENVDAVVAQVRELLGDEVDVVAEKDNLLAPVGNMLQTIESVTHTGVWLALGTAGIVILATMIIVVRERNHEIGVLKAIGAARSDIIQLFTLEALALVTCGLLVGIIFFAAGNQFLTNRLLALSMPSPGGVMGGPEGMIRNLGGGMRAVGGMFGRAGLNLLLGDMTISLEWKPLLTSLAGLVATSFVGSLIPAIYAAQLKPTEVLRNE